MKTFFSNFKKYNGQILIESIVSISIATIGLLGILTLLSRSIYFNRNVTNNLVATYLAAEGIEIIKNIEDTNYANSRRWNLSLDDGSYEVQYNTIIPNSIAGLLSSNPLNFDSSNGVGIYTYTPSQPATTFYRTIQITNISNEEIQVNSIVKWTDKGEVKEVNLEDHFFDWRTEYPIAP